MLEQKLLSKKWEMLLIGNMVHHTFKQHTTHAQQIKLKHKSKYCGPWLMSLSMLGLLIRVMPYIM